MKIAVLGCKGTTIDFIHRLKMGGIVDVALVISIPQEIAEKNKVAFYEGAALKEYCAANNIKFHEVAHYALTDEADQKFIAEQNLDLMLVIGWERLLPDAVLQSLKYFACGMHGSAFGLPRGRGRSPLNWSLIQGLSKFTTSLFRYTPGVDDGDIIGSQTFDVNQFDDISSLHIKNRIAMVNLVETYVPKIANGEIAFQPQPPTMPTFYPKRTAEDGQIDWSMNAEEIYNLVRAVKPPYPSAFSFINGKKLLIGNAAPFDTGVFYRKKSGEILDISLAENKLIVQCGKGTILLSEISGIAINELKIGDIFDSFSNKKNMAEIVKRYDSSIAPEQWEIYAEKE
ncbi:MAG: hypothetical protein COV36_02205 [Alphaproteobacteria bacterium CG11_big_fil_rev_8_21_14_0_20_44_7]|nr:MAG: hypothetical protein COV36_02205 [Alphaproteobacteria bacterium CG11_big_fil_rev_8_21_14_0_20_44_7]